jgi:hypothetical protein
MLGATQAFRTRSIAFPGLFPTGAAYRVCTIDKYSNTRRNSIVNPPVRRVFVDDGIDGEIHGLDGGLVIIIRMCQVPAQLSCHVEERRSFCLIPSPFFNFPDSMFELQDSNKLY